MTPVAGVASSLPQSGPVPVVIEQVRPADRASVQARPRYESLDAWRGVACLLVILYHSTMILRGHHVTPDGAVELLAGRVVTATSYGNMGVALFFVISGYCIAAAGESVRTGRHSVPTYFFRRFRRIYPPFWAIVALSCLFFLILDVALWPKLLSTEPWLQPRPWWFSNWQWLGNLTLTETWRNHVIGGPHGHFPGQSWTLCYEEQFYAVTGLLLLVGRRRFFSGAIVVTSLTLCAMAAASWWGWQIKGFFFDGAWLLFAAGVLVYWSLHEDRGRRRLWAGAICILAAAIAPVGIAGAAAAFVFAAVLLVTHRYDLTLARSRWVRPLTSCGQMCYSLYLVHQLLVKAVSTAMWEWGVQSAVATLLLVVPACVATSILAGRVCYLAIERRFLNTPRLSITDRASCAQVTPRATSRLLS